MFELIGTPLAYGGTKPQWYRHALTFYLEVFMPRIVRFSQLGGPEVLTLEEPE